MERNGRLTDLARELRKNQTKEEALLWYNFLCKAPLRFHRQYVIGNYIVDFYCHKAKLVIELDGSQHYELEGKQRDAVRDSYLESMGLTVVRYSNAEINREFRVVCEDIWNRIKKPSP